MTLPPTTTLMKTAGASGAELASIAGAAADALSRGLLAIMPTETVYGLAANAASADSVTRLAQATAPSRPPGHAAIASAWHVHSVDLVRDIIDPPSFLHRHLMRRLLPGPVTFVIEKSAGDLELIRAELGAAHGAIHNGREIAVRIPDHAVARDVLAAAWNLGFPVIAEGIAGAALGRGIALPPDLHLPSVGTGSPALEWIGAVIDDGPTRYGKPSTVVRLRADGSFDVVSEGVLEERFIRKQLDRNILFVCTGNTCRSPMAEAIAANLVARDTGTTGVRTRVRSAGVAADDGEPISPEAVKAIRALGIEPSDLARRTSRELTRQMLAEADVIFAMTAGHARAVAAMDPPSAHKVMVLDPEGGDVPDPIGGPQELYTQTARRLAELIQQRLAELDRA